MLVAKSMERQVEFIPMKNINYKYLETKSVGEIRLTCQFLSVAIRNNNNPIFVDDN